MRGELQPFEAGIYFGGGEAAPFGHLLDRAGVEDRGDRTVLPLEQERRRRAPDLVVRVVASHPGDRPIGASVSADDRRDHVEELGGHRDHSLAVGFRRRDDQQRDDLATGPLVLPDAQVAELAQLLDAHAGVPQRLHRRPVPRRGFLVSGDVDHLAAVVVARTRWNRRAVTAELAIGFAQHGAGDALAGVSANGTEAPLHPFKPRSPPGRMTCPANLSPDAPPGRTGEPCGRQVSWVSPCRAGVRNAPFSWACPCCGALCSVRTVVTRPPCAFTGSGCRRGAGGGCGAGVPFEPMRDGRGIVGQTGGRAVS